MTALDRSSMITRLCSSMLHQNHGTSPRLNERKTIISNGCSRKRYYNTNHNMLTIILMTFMIFVSNMIVVIGGRKRYNGHPQSRSIRVINESGYRFDLYWIHVQTRELGESNTKDEGVMFGSETHITSYIGHEFTIKELPGKISGVCRSSGTKDICKSINITVNANEEQCTYIIIVICLIGYRSLCPVYHVFRCLSVFVCVRRCWFILHSLFILLFYYC